MAEPSVLVQTARQVLDMAARQEPITINAVANAIHRNTTSVSVYLKGWTENGWLTRGRMPRTQPGVSPPYVHTLTLEGAARLMAIVGSS